MYNSESASAHFVHGILYTIHFLIINQITDADLIFKTKMKTMKFKTKTETKT